MIFRLFVAGATFIVLATVFMSYLRAHKHKDTDRKSFYYRGFNEGYEARSIDGGSLTSPIDRIARLRKWVNNTMTTNAGSVDILTLCDDYYTLLARFSLTTEERNAIQRWLSEGVYSTEEKDLIQKVLRRALE